MVEKRWKNPQRFRYDNISKSAFKSYHPFTKTVIPMRDPRNPTLHSRADVIGSCSRRRRRRRRTRERGLRRGSDRGQRVDERGGVTHHT